jgi:hypothetical protein
MDKRFIFLVSIIGSVAIFFIFRFVSLWYFKINEHLENQKKIIFLLEEIKLNQHHYKTENL